MESIYELHPALASSHYPLRIRAEKQSNNGYLHWHKNLELLYLTEGKCTVINGTEELPLQSGEIAVFNSETLHYVKAKGSPCAYILTQLDAAYFESMGFDISGCVIKKIIHDEQIRSILERSLYEQENELPYYHESVKAMMLQMLVIIFRKHLAEDFRNNDHSNRAKLVKQLAEYIENHYQEELTVESISHACGYSRFYISRTFKAVTGLTVVAYINATRVQQAKTLFKNSNLSVCEIAMQCGFSNQAYFSKVFKRHENLSPLEYKSMVRK